jgi:penicillin-binding protein 2
MPTLTIQDRVRETRMVRRRLLIAVIIVVALLATIVARLFYLQVTQHAHYTTLSKDNRVRVLPLAPTRGRIYSRDGELLAENRPSFALELIPEQVPDMEDTLRRLRRIIDITDIDVERFRKAKRQMRRFDEVPLRFNLTEEEVARLSVDKHLFPGVEIVASLNRYYPLGAELAHVIGYVGRIDENELRTLDAANYSATNHIGKSGIEQSYEKLLHGRVGYQQVEVNSRGRILRVLDRTPAVAGDDLHLTLDVPLQRVAAKALGNKRGAVVAIDVKTGGVLALVSKPSYDPNLFVNGISVPLYAELRDSADQPLFNRALQAQYPPGSTVKPFMALAGLYYGVRKADDTTWCPGWYSLPGDSHRYRCWRKIGHGHIDMTDAIIQSCDVYFYELARDLKIDRMHEFLDFFGFGRKTGIDVPRENTAVNPSRAWKRAARHLPWFPGETLIAGIGQGFLSATPLQLANAVSVMARRGIEITPHLVDSINVSGGSLKPLEWAAHRAVPDTNPKDWDLVINAMHGVVQSARGTARRSAEGAPYEYAGKTGTSQVYGIAQNEEGGGTDNVPENLRDHALFISFAPLDSPRIAVAVVVEHGEHGGSAAAPVARRVIDEYLLKAHAYLPMLKTNG